MYLVRRDDPKRAPKQEQEQQLTQEEAAAET
jgi:hypothetical protein